MAGQVEAIRVAPVGQVVLAGELAGRQPGDVDAEVVRESADDLSGQPGLALDLTGPCPSRSVSYNGRPYGPPHLEIHGVGPCRLNELRLVAPARILASGPFAAQRMSPERIAHRLLAVSPVWR